jgi:calcineurin-like phosphoesterase family protein
MTVYFTSDTHWSHQNILTLGRGRPFATIEEHDEFLVYQWNETVKAEDFVYHLGDVALGKIADSLPIVGRLNGHIALLPGNHDRVSSAMSEKNQKHFTPEYLKYFREIMPEVVSITFRSNSGFGSLDVILSHYPPVGDSHDQDRFDKLRPKHERNKVYIHGHTHQSEKWTITDRGAILISVGVDARNWTPVSLDEVLDDIIEARKQTRS